MDRTGSSVTGSLTLRSSRARGFTLLEVMLAVSIVSIALVTILHSFSLIARSQRRAWRTTRAIFLIEEKLNALPMQSPQEWEPEGRFPSPLEDFSWQLQSTGVASGVLEKVSLTVSWQEGRRREEIRVSTYIRKNIL